MPKYKAEITKTVTYGFAFDAKDDAQAQRILDMMRGGVESGDVDERGDVTKLGASSTGSFEELTGPGASAQDDTDVHFVRFGNV